MDDNEFSIANDVDNKNFTEFSKAVKNELQHKLVNSPEVQQYSSDMDKMEKMKDIFSQIKSVEEENKKGEYL